MDPTPLPPLTPADFEIEYDATHTYPFFEDDNGVVWGYFGQRTDRAAIAGEVADYFAYTAGERPDISPSDVKRRWATRPPRSFEDAFVTGTYDEAGEFVPFTADTPGAVPVWKVEL